MSELAAILLGFAAGAVGGPDGRRRRDPVRARARDLPRPVASCEAEATSLLAIIPVAVVGAWRQHGYGNVRLRDGLVIGALSPVGRADRGGGRRTPSRSARSRSASPAWSCSSPRQLVRARLARRGRRQPSTLTKDLQRPLDARRGRRRDASPRAFAAGRAARAARLAPRARRRSRAASGTPKIDDVGLDARRVDRRPAAARQGPRPGGRALAWSSARRSTWWSSAYSARGRDDPGLAHRAAHHLLVAPRFVDQLLRAGQHGADRRAQPLREVDPGGVEAARVVGGRDAARDDRVHQPRAVEVRAQPVLDARRRARRRSPRSGQTRPPPMLVVCSTDTSRERGAVAVAGRAQRLRDLRRGEDAAVAVERRAASRPRAPPGRPPRSWTGCDVRSRITSSPPGRTCSRNAIALHIVPEGRKSAASLPSSSATRSCSAFTVGSSKRCSSPTSASAIACRIAARGPRLRVAEEVDGLHLNRVAATAGRPRAPPRRPLAARRRARSSGKCSSTRAAGRVRDRASSAASARRIAVGELVGSGACVRHCTPRRRRPRAARPRADTTGMQPASIASATDSPKPSWRRPARTRPRAGRAFSSACSTQPVSVTLAGAAARSSSADVVDPTCRRARTRRRAGGPQPGRTASSPLRSRLRRSTIPTVSARRSRPPCGQLAERIRHAVVDDRHPRRGDAPTFASISRAAVVGVCDQPSRAAHHPAADAAASAARC